MAAGKNKKEEELDQLARANYFLWQVERARQDGCQEMAASWASQVVRTLQGSDSPIVKFKIHEAIMEWSQKREDAIREIVYLCRAFGILSTWELHISSLDSQYFDKERR